MSVRLHAFPLLEVLDAAPEPPPGEFVDVLIAGQDPTGETIVTISITTRRPELLADLAVGAGVSMMLRRSAAELAREAIA